MTATLAFANTLLGSALVAAALSGQTATFDAQTPGEAPKGWTCALSGEGRPGAWVVTKDATAPSGALVLAQTHADATNRRFPHCVVDALTARDVDLRVKLKPVAGQKDQAGGLVWRYRDAGNYYVVRANALEGNVVLYKFENGKRTDLKPKGAGASAYGRQATVPNGAWSELRVTAKGNLFTVYFAGDQLFEVQDSTFSEPGQVGVWTKADSIIHFDGFEVRELPSS